LGIQVKALGGKLHKKKIRNRINSGKMKNPGGSDYLREESYGKI